MSEIAKRLKMKQPVMGKAKLEEDPDGPLVEYNQIMAQLAEDLREVKSMKDLNKNLEEKLATKEKETETQQRQIEEMKDLLEKAMTTIKSLEESQGEMTKAMEQTQEATAKTMINLPQLKPIEEIIENADPGKSVIEVWGPAVWKQLSPEIQAEIITVYTNALIDPQIIQRQMELMQGLLNPDLSQPVTSPGEPVSYTEAQEDLNIPQETGTNTVTKELPSGS